MKLIKHIPARTEVSEFTWCKKSFTTMSEKYRRIRKGMEPMDTCWYCQHKICDGEKMALASPGGPHTNVILCHPCADILLASKEAQS